MCIRDRDDNAKFQIFYNQFDFSTRCLDKYEHMLESGFDFSFLKCGDNLRGFLNYSNLYSVAEYKKFTEFFIRVGFNINQKDSNGETLLFHTENPNAIQALLEFGIDPNIQNDEGECILNSYYSLKKLYLVKLLLDYGADPNKKSKEGMIPHATAIMSNLPNIAIYLIQHGAKISEFPGGSESCLQHAKNLVTPNLNVKKELIDLISLNL